MSKRDGWIPRDLPGGVYCSPACGGQCTKATYDLAVQDGAALAVRMGKGWEPVVWENLGWHYKVKKGVASIHLAGKTRRPTDNKFMIFFNTIPQVVVSA